ncbi:PilW family protein [Glaciimonas immobilis]|uniref:Type IV pilus assembly protein PilW n=1 Tax=Glaciimonas immobilis TaxID=728004 RepID=A0A840RV87_9BURK|nr:PilW family protein [Glaciimonas immobilis]KAF3997698.1 prepilin-type N-terminal cleavage/methylation domain-containing protein [Glaciimonas immobilis]MBB5200584.1 type IV pilus assembly protein PilW [Glaciimonas immobilis]
MSRQPIFHARQLVGMPAIITNAAIAAMIQLMMEPPIKSTSPANQRLFRPTTRLSGHSNLGLAYRQETGFSLIELMVALALGLALIVVVTSLFFSTQLSARLNFDNGNMQEDGYVAMTTIGRNLMQAGYGNMLTTTTTDFGGVGFKACQKGFKMPLTTDLTCKAHGLPEFLVSYVVDRPKDAKDYNNADCNNFFPLAEKVEGSKPLIVTNRFFLQRNFGEDSPSLYCQGNGEVPAGEDGAQPIMGNVIDMGFTFGVDTKGQYAPTTFYTNTDQVQALPVSAGNKTNWDQVISVKVCLEAHSTNLITTRDQTFTDCHNVRKTVNDKRLYRTFTRTFALRNHAQPTLMEAKNENPQ